MRTGVHLPTMHRHVAVPLLHGPPVLLLRGGDKQEVESDQGGTHMCRSHPGTVTHLHLGSSGLLVKAHGHGVAGYPEEVCQRHRFPLRTKRVLNVTRVASAGAKRQRAAEPSRKHGSGCQFSLCRQTDGGFFSLLAFKKVQNGKDAAAMIENSSSNTTCL